MNYTEESLRCHKQWRGKICVEPKMDLSHREVLAIAYTPGVAAPCQAIAKQPAKAYDYTIKASTVAVVSDGSAVLGLGNIGPLAALPVMEGKAALFKAFGGINAIPLCLDTQDTDEIVETVIRIAPAFGGINLEDIAAPRCFEVERRLMEALSIPVFHDDQHGTAIVVLAALINALKVVKKPLQSSSVVINGAGAAGIAITKLLHSQGLENIVLVDRWGILNSADQNLTQEQNNLLEFINPSGLQGNLSDALRGADVFIGVSVPCVLDAKMVASMHDDAIVFALANPTPEIDPEQALAAGARLVGTGRSDYPNQINNVAAFPGIFKGALEAGATRISEAMKLASAHALASLIPDDQLNEQNILVDPTDPRVVVAVANAVKRCVQENCS